MMAEKDYVEAGFPYRGHPVPDYGYCQEHQQYRCKDCGQCHGCAADFLAQNMHGPPARIRR